ncbi:unnamed protein product [Acidithrix sp. C25]|nr:unnamed protein product [Acidithrix sp. C25]
MVILFHSFYSFWMAWHSSSLVLTIAEYGFPFFSERGGIALLAIILSLVLYLLFRKQRSQANAAKQISASSKYIARLNQIANDVHEESELLALACDLAVSDGGFRTSAIVELTNGELDQLDLVFESQGSGVFEGYFEAIKPAVRIGLDAGSPYFLELPSTLTRHIFSWRRVFEGKSTAVVLPLKNYLKNPSALILVTFDNKRHFPANQFVKELMAEIANDLMRGIHRIELVKRDLKTSAMNETLLGSLGVGINVVRYPERVIEIANQKLLDIAKAKDLEEFRNQPVRSLYLDDEQFERVGELAKLVEMCGSGSLDTVGYRTITGEKVFLDMSGRLLNFGDGITRIVWTQIDVTDRVEADRQRNEIGKMRDVLLNNTVAGIDLVEYPTRRIIEANLAFAEMLGYGDLTELIGMNTSTLYTLDSENARMAALSRSVLSSGQGSLSDLQVLKKDGSTIYVDIHGRYLDGGDSESQVVVWTSVDVTGRHQLNDELRRFANFDSLTNLPNRRALHQYLEEAIARARSDERHLAVGVIDLDDFKPVNDVYGHLSGDELLKEFARRLKSVLRSGDFASRLGGDEFVVILEGLSKETLESQLETVLLRLYETVESPFEIDGGHLVNVGMSMGISFSNPTIDEPDILVRMADSAMFAIKKLKGNRKRWWLVADSKIEDAVEIVTIDPYGSEANFLLENLSKTVASSIQSFVSDFYDRLIQDGSISKNLNEISPDELESLKAIQVQSLNTLIDCSSGVEPFKEFSRHLGAVHAYVGTSSSALIEITNLYRKFMDTALDEMSIRSIDRLRTQSALEARLQLDLQMQLTAMDEAIESYRSVLSSPLPQMSENWLDVILGEARVLGGLTGILGCQLWRPNLEGVFYPDINVGFLQGAIEEVVARSILPRLDSRFRTGAGLVPAAMLSGEITFSYSFSSDPRTVSWHDLLHPLGVHSVVAIPIADRGSPSSVLVLHGAYPNQFSSKWSASFSMELCQRWSQLFRRIGEKPNRLTVREGEAFRKLLYSGALTMYAQPIVDIASGDTIKVEMLARLTSFDGSVITPGQFLPSFSDGDLDTLFLQGLDQSLRQLQAWDRQGLKIDLSMNIAPSTVLNPQSNLWLKQHLDTYSIDPQRITLELVENQEITGDRHSDAVRTLSKIGIRLAIDDLGSGYSSLKRLASLPFDVIKVDQSIVRALKYDPIANLSLIRTIIQIGDDFDRYVIVEGLESRAEIEAIHLLGATVAQGFEIAKPMPAGMIYKWVTEKEWQRPRFNEISSYLGALAYHMAYIYFERATAKSDANECPVDAFLAISGYHDSEINECHRQIHSGIDRDRRRELSRSLLGWLADKVREGEE